MSHHPLSFFHFFFASLTSSYILTISSMRYAQIIRPYRRSPNFKLGHIFALHLRHSKASSLLVLIITFPFFAATILSIPQPQDTQQRNAIPQPSQNITDDPFNLSNVHHNRVNITIPHYIQHQASRRTSQINPDQSITLIAACMNRRESLGLSLPSWEAIPQIDQIILVDWSSVTSTNDIPHLPDMMTTARLSLIRVENADTWILSRAYNLASKFATGKYILKVDCDTHLDASFLEKQPPLPDGRYYTTTWGSERDTNERKLRGVWFGRATDFRSVGGYDERIVGYGYEDTDLYTRFDAFLEAIPLGLDYVRHNTAGDAVWRRKSVISKRVSTRMNEAFLSKIPPWRDVLEAGNASTYDYSYDSDTHILYASITRMPVAVHDEIDFEEVQRMKAEVLQKALHDDFSIPWDILPSLDTSDLEYLAAYLDNDRPDHIIIATLEGQNTLSNLFNLVSALQLGITTGRPVIAVWSPPVGNTTLLSQLVNIAETNERLQQVVQSLTARRHGFSKTSRLIAAREWKCEEGIPTCAKAYDRAYSELVEIVLTGNRVYDERDPLPLSIRHHAFVRLGNNTKLGSSETRALAYGCIVLSDIVSGKKGLFDSRIGVVASSARNYSRLVTAVEATRDRRMVAVVGPGEYAVRKGLFGDAHGFCESDCGVQEMAMEMANVVGVVSAGIVVPDVGDGSRGAWETNSQSVDNMMVADLRTLYRLLADSESLQT